MTLPPLPEPNVERISGHREPFISYDADQMREYGKQCREAALEEAARLVEKYFDVNEPWMNPHEIRALK